MGSEPQQQWSAEVCAVPRQPFELSVRVTVVLCTSLCSDRFSVGNLLSATV